MVQATFVAVFIVCFFLLNVETYRPKSRKRPHKRSLFKPKEHMNPSICVDTLCNDTVTYPQKFVQQLMAEKYEEYIDFMGVAYSPFEQPKVVMRFYSENQEHAMCETRIARIEPMRARNIHYEWKYIIQTEERKQAVIYEVCLPNSKCFADGFLPDGYKTTCTQNKVVVKLLALGHNGQMSFDLFPISGGCVCTYKL